MDAIAERPAAVLADLKRRLLGKPMVSRPKHIALLAGLHAAGLIDVEVVRVRLDFLDLPVESVSRLHLNFRNVFGA